MNLEHSLLLPCGRAEATLGQVWASTQESDWVSEPFVLIFLLSHCSHQGEAAGLGIITGFADQQSTKEGLLLVNSLAI